MDKLIPNIVKQLAQTHTPITKKFLSSPLPCGSLAMIRKEIEKKVLRTPTTNFITFCDNISFENYLNSVIPLSHRKNVSYHLNSKVLPSLLPSGCKVSVWSPALFSLATKLTHPENITFSNPYKTFQGLIDARKFGLTNMIINTFQEIHKILHQPQTAVPAQKYKFIWEFQEIDYKECKSVLKDLIRRKIKLSGVRFKQGYRDQFQEMEKIIQVGCKFGHDLSHNSYEVGIENFKNIQNLTKNLQKQQPLIMDLDTSPFVLCASRVFGKNKRTTVHSQASHPFINNSTTLGAVQVNGKEWTLFSPTQCWGLQEASDDVLKRRLILQ